ncbi:translational GTPase TypA [Buchnera aphidicola]|uniref:50S ribosomal subunit assembly factor BipA n=1 Tax=Buchnera aphidicola (Sarucallis kahawaluokalani) TaxID=1241878 RepID=A0A4D6YJK1_9GAMM|nr:translational GTPase TypA [Buchnera aphidicola]QCI26070.1 translational GTPase TypA [Buchnera aphidicola (Sarucallis kahawaluokalani)]
MTTIQIRNIAIIAHIDHGKTTLLDQILEQSGSLNQYKEKCNRIMDSNILEKERGITIFSKNTAIQWNNYKINIIDTPGHADFGGEVERILSMVDSVLLIVDAVDGPMPQTRFVTKKAFEYNLNPIVVINKIDRNNARPEWVIEKIFDLFINLNATDKQLDFPVIYTSAISGKSGSDLDHIKNDMSALLQAIIKYTPPPKVNPNNNLKIQISQLSYDNYLGNIGIGKIQQGSIHVNQKVSIIDHMKNIKYGRIGKILKYLGLEKIETKNALAGEIVAITGLPELKISDTICDLKNIQALPPIKIEPPTVNILLAVNTSPFCGKEGKYVTANNIYNRLKKERIHDIALCIKHTKNSNTFSVSGRGELHLSILIENMRREGFELEVSRPKVILKNKNNVQTEPFESVIIEIEERHQGIVMEYMGQKKAKMINIYSNISGRIQLEYITSSRSLIGFRNTFMNITSGTGIIYSSFLHYDIAQKDQFNQRKNGVLISNATGLASGFALYNLQDRGKLFIEHANKVYKGQIIGIHNRTNDLTVNCLTGKKLTNMRASGTDDAITLIPVIKMTLEKALGFINDDELIEVTPKSIRIRKKFLEENDRKVEQRKLNKK